MKMIKLTMVSTALISLSATFVFAEAEVGLFFQQSTMDINEVILEQTVDGNDLIDLSLSGDMTSVVIRQSGTAASSSGNSAIVNIYATTNVTSLSAFTPIIGETRITDANRGSHIWKTFSATFDGNNNKLVFDLGSSDISTIGYSDIDVNLAVTGDENTLTHTITSGLADETLQLDGIVNGDKNTVLTTISAVGNVAFNYNIQGSENTLTGTLAGPTGGRSVAVALTGDSNVWTVTANSSGGTLDVTANGSSMTGTHTQTGDDANLKFDITQAVISPFAITTTQSGANNSADVKINAASGGAFTLTQSSANASYTGVLNIAAGGAVTITQ
jgi:hypothetical protein